MSIEQRNAVVKEAMTWLGTPYHHAANIKGAGVDCAMILAEVYYAAGVVKKKPVLGEYPSDWMLHRSEERYLKGLMKYGHETDVAQAGDVVVWKIGRCFSHGAIVVDYPTIIHAYRKSGIVTLDTALLSELDDKERKIFTFWD